MTKKELDKIRRRPQDFGGRLLEEVDRLRSVKAAKIRLYVWKGVLRDYTSGIAVAAARFEAEARTAILAAAKDDCQLATLAGQILRAPDEVLDLPAAAYVCGGG